MNRQQIQFFYVRSAPDLASQIAFEKVAHKPHKKRPLGFPVGCVAYQLVKDQNGTNYVKFAWTSYNRMDNFEREAARARALYYLLFEGEGTDEGLHRSWVAHDKSNFQTMAHIMRIVAGSDTASFKVQAAARHWLESFEPPTEASRPEKYIRPASGASQKEISKLRQEFRRKLTAVLRNELVKKPSTGNPGHIDEINKAKPYAAPDDGG